MTERERNIYKVLILNLSMVKKKLKVSWIRHKNKTLIYMIPFPLLRKNEKFWDKIMWAKNVKITMEII